MKSKHCILNIHHIQEIITLEIIIEVYHDYSFKIRAEQGHLGVKNVK